MTEEDLASLKAAKLILENPGFAIKASNLLGKPIEKGLDLLPAKWQQNVGSLTRAALMQALKTALLTMGRAKQGTTPRWHKAAATASGAAGGFFGLAALAVELPVSTTIMCRAIADIARSHGEDLDAMESRLACIEVFALGGPTRSDDAAESGYFAVRGVLARAVSEAVDYLAANTLTETGAPALVRLLTLVATRFKIQVTERAAAQAIPIIGAAGGAAVNYLFIDHFQTMSRGHFAVRRLERLYGRSMVEREYRRL